MSVEQTLLTQYHQYQSQLADRVLYLACSGGRDSLSLAWAWLQLYRQGKLPCLPILLHVNHHWQQDSNKWATQVADFAKKQQMVYYLLDVAAGDNENSARQARYQAMFEMMVDDGVLLLAHHSDDQAETLLMRLVNGAGLVGLSAMQAWQDRYYHGKKLVLFRPWLLQSRLAITDYAHAHQLPYIDDPTNTDGDNTRSLIRTQLIPVLNKLNQQAVANIARSSRVLDDSRQIVKEAVAARLTDAKQAAACLGDLQQALMIGRLFGQSEAMWRAVLYEFIKGDSVYGANAALVERLLVLCQRCDGDHQTQYYWQSCPQHPSEATAYVFCRYHDVLYRYRADFWGCLSGDDMALEWQIEPWGAVLPFVTAVSDWAGLGLKSGEIDQITKLSKNDKVHVRHRQLSGKKLYQMLKIPPWYRRHLWLLDCKVQEQKVQYLLAIGQAWQLNQADTPPRLPQFCLMASL